MGSIIEKFKNILGLNEELHDEEGEPMATPDLDSLLIEHNPHSQEEEVKNDLESYRKKKVQKPNNTNIIDFSTASPNEMIVVEPTSYDDALKVVSLLKSKVAVIISFVNSGLSHEDMMHIIDFICGAVCAIEGNQKIVAPSVYLFTPGNININTLDSEHHNVVDKSGNNLFLTVSDISLNKSASTEDSETKAS